ncbi:MAG: (Fe-S)-binding protein [Gammaproteobacteria bacterium]
MRRALITDAERCVKCALCLPHCPTYGLKHEEGDSPRGRIALIQALAENSLAPTPATLQHLDGCLTCRACEAVCPADVPYGRLIDGARADLAALGKPSWFTRLVMHAARHPGLITRVVPRLHWAARLPLPSALARLRPYLQSLHALPPLARGPADGEPVALFLGCIARALDTEALGASAELLAAAGYRVETPPGQTCCGALALHSGDRVTAHQLAARNLVAFEDQPMIVAAATGCTAQFAEYGALLEQDDGFSRRVHDVTDLLARALEEGRLSLRQSERTRVALHTPCTLRNVLRSDAGRRCLAALTNVDIVELPPGCCGAAGSYFLDRPQDSEALRIPLLGAIRDARADCVVTANVGCRLHLAAGLAGDPSAPKVLHIASFLARRLLANARIPS